MIAFAIVLVLIAILLVQLAHLQIFSYGYYNTKSNNNRIEVIRIPASRGIIYDRNGTPLALNQRIYQLNIIPDKIKNLDEQLTELKELVNLTDEEIDNFSKARRQYSSHRPVPLKYNLTEKEIAQFVVNQHLFPFVNITTTEHRYYPYGSALSHVVGYVSKINDKDDERLKQEGRRDKYVENQNIGKIGIERYYENTLQGEPGSEQVEVTSQRRIVRQLNRTPPQIGEDIYLTIDLNLQLYITKLLGDRRAAVVAIDPNNGEVLALVSSPSYDPNLFVDGISYKKFNELNNNPDRPMFNRATQGNYPPASTVKPFISIAALSEGVITPKTIVYDPGYWALPGTEKKYRDWLRWGHGKVDVVKALEESVDTFFYQVAYDLGIDRLYYWMTKFGYGQRSGIDLAADEESRANLPSREWKLARHKHSWLQGDTIPVGIGQGYWTATPIQMAKALTILINEGAIYTPHLVRYTKNQALNSEMPPYVEHSSIDNKESSPLVNHQYWRLAKEGMYKVLFGSRGTARKVFANSEYKAAAKSGTAQVFSLKADETYNADELAEHLRDHALFIAYAPYDKPTIALAIVLENGGGGSSQGGAVAKKIFDYYLLGDESTTISKSILEMKQDDR